MPVKYYKAGEHPTGFVGHRVYRSVGGRDSQRYYSNQEFGYTKGKKLAFEQDRKWAEDSGRVKKEQRISQSPSRGGKGVIVSGLRADISARGRNLYIGFFVIRPGTTNSIYFGTKRAGYVQAWTNAVSEYCMQYGYDDGVKLKLISQLPDKTIFTDHLLNRHNSKGNSLTLEQLQTYLNN